MKKARRGKDCSCGGGAAAGGDLGLVGGGGGSSTGFSVMLMKSRVAKELVNRVGSHQEEGEGKKKAKKDDGV